MNKKKKLIISITSAIIVIAGAICVYIANRPLKVPDPRKDPAAARKFLGSDDFDKLTPQQQTELVHSMRPDRRPTPQEMAQLRKEMESMTPEQRRKMMENMRKVRMREMDQQFDEFFRLPKAEQLKELDRRIAEQDKRRAEMAKRRAAREQSQNSSRSNTSNQNNQQTTPPDANGNPDRPRRPNAQMRREFEADIPATTRAKMQQYRQMERLRREGKLK